MSWYRTLFEYWITHNLSTTGWPLCQIKFNHNSQHSPPLEEIHAELTKEDLSILTITTSNSLRCDHLFIHVNNLVQFIVSYHSIAQSKSKFPNSNKNEKFLWIFLHNIDRFVRIFDVKNACWVSVSKIHKELIMMDR